MYKVKNKLNQPVKCNDILFKPYEVKELDFKPTSDKFIVEQVEKKEKLIKSKGGNK